MNKYRSRNSSFGRGNRGYNHNNNFSRNRNNNSRKHFGKKLNHSLFIHKPIEENTNFDPIHEIKNSFQDFDVVQDLKQNIAQKNYTTPTPIQDKAIPEILLGKDVIGIANTGTGKTAAFLIPLINKVAQNPHEKVLIVTPTRELAMQIRDELFDFTNTMNIYSVLAIGGASMGRQMNNLSKKFNFVIGTPGRIKDLIKRNSLHLSSFNSFVLDEVDRMVDIGFIKDIEFLISLLPNERQSLFFSATVTGKVESILRSFVKNPVTISVKTHDTAKSIEQDIVKIKDKGKKIDVLHDLLIQDGFDKVIVFGRTKWGIEKLSNALSTRGFKTVAIHGNKSQGQRQRALSEFKNNEAQILLATDVASRGIDVEDVTHVINFDAPESYDDYVHRIGRTGRANKKGKALTFVE